MQRNYKNFCLIILLPLLALGSAVFVATGPSSVYGDTASDLRNKIQSTADQIEKLKEEIKIYESSLNQTAEKAASLKNELDSLNLAKKKLEADLKVTNLNLSKTTATINSIGLEINDTEKAINKKRLEIASSISDLRMNDNTSPIESILSAQNISEVSEYIDQTDSLNGSISKGILELQTLTENLTGKKVSQLTKQDELKKLQADLSGQQKAIAGTASQKTKLLTDTKNDEATYQKILNEKMKQQAQFEADLFKFESDLKIAVDPSKLPSTKTAVLSWPLASITVTQQFGKTSSSGRLYASGTHNGVDFRAVDGTKVFAALAGTVTATGNTDAKKSCYSYGKWILIKHANGLSTLYGHLSSILVEPGQSVNTGDTIGLSGRTGYVTGPHLHLTVLATEGVKVLPIPTATPCNGVVIPIGTPEAFLDPLAYLPQLK